ncbi:protein of unknown function [Burkholderia multivorans]
MSCAGNNLQITAIAVLTLRPFAPSTVTVALSIGAPTATVPDGWLLALGLPLLRAPAAASARAQYDDTSGGKEPLDLHSFFHEIRMKIEREINVSLTGGVARVLEKKQLVKTILALNSHAAGNRSRVRQNAARLKGVDCASARFYAAP